MFGSHLHQIRDSFLTFGISQTEHVFYLVTIDASPEQEARPPRMTLIVQALVAAEVQGRVEAPGGPYPEFEDAVRKVCLMCVVTSIFISSISRCCPLPASCTR